MASSAFVVVFLTSFWGVHVCMEFYWRYSDLPNVPVVRRCQPGVLRQLHVKGTVSSELGRWLPVFHCKVHEGHRSLRIVVCVCSGFPSSARLQNEWDIERCALQPVTPFERTAVSHCCLQSGWSFGCNRGQKNVQQQCWPLVLIPTDW